MASAPLPVSLPRATPVRPPDPLSGPVGGWFFPRAGAIALDEGEQLTLLDAEGRELGRFGGAAGAALHARLSSSGGGPLDGLLAVLVRTAPALAEVLAEAPLPLAPGCLLRRAGWTQLFLELTATCNERCLHCYADAGPERREALAQATVEAALAEAAGLGFQVVQWTGGEALLVPWLALTIARAADLGIAVREVYTNGTLLDAERYAPLRAAGASFAFSLYAADPAVHDAVTGLPGSHARTCAALRRALDGGSAVRVSLIVVRPDLEDEALRGALLARELGVAEGAIGIEVARAIGRGTASDRPPPALPWEQPGVAARALHAPGAPVTAGASADPWSRGGPGKAAILPDGSVVPCIFARAPRLGRVTAAGGLRQALERPAVSLRALSPSHTARALGAAACGLSCAECRWPAALLEAREGAP